MPPPVVAPYFDWPGDRPLAGAIIKPLSRGTVKLTVGIGMQGVVNLVWLPLMR